ncbi:toxin-antitoxin system HicB family antitoxin [Actinomycetes bacterium M1A6_2h]
MNLDTYTARLSDDLVAAAALGDDHTQQVAAALGTAAQNSARLMLLAALADLATEVSEQADGFTVHVRLSGTDAVVDVVRDEPVISDEHVDPRTAFDEAAGDISRVTLRLAEQMKARAEEAAQQNGMSLNSWMSKAMQGALRDQLRKN